MSVKTALNNGVQLQTYEGQRRHIKSYTFVCKLCQVLCGPSQISAKNRQNLQLSLTLQQSCATRSRTEIENTRNTFFLSSGGD